MIDLCSILYHAKPDIIISNRHLHFPRNTNFICDLEDLDAHRMVSSLLSSAIVLCPLLHHLSSFTRLFSMLLSNQELFSGCRMPKRARRTACAVCVCVRPVRRHEVENVPCVQWNLYSFVVKFFIDSRTPLSVSIYLPLPRHNN